MIEWCQDVLKTGICMKQPNEVKHFSMYDPFSQLRSRASVQTISYTFQYRWTLREHDVCLLQLC